MMDSQSPGASKNTSTTSPNSLRPPVQDIKCPRCDSSNTKFCYYNNYSLTQPRHFCKTCRRYWTKGGALRNVPVGGGCRKSKKSKSSASSSSSSSSSSRLPFDHFDTMADPTGGGLNFFPGLSPALAGDLQLGVFPFSRLHSSASNQFISGATSMVGLNYPSPSAVGLYSEMGGGGSSFAVNNSTHSSLSSSIESLSSINQDLHWKLQQQRLGMLFGGGTHKESTLPAPLADDQQEPISFQVTDSSRAEVSGTNTTTAWFLENSYTMPNTTNNKMTNNNSTTNNNSDDNNNNNNNTSNWNGIPTWNDMHQFTTLP